MVGTQDQILKAKAEADAMKEHYSLACPSHYLLSLLFYTTQVHFGVALMFPFTAITNQENAPHTHPQSSPDGDNFSADFPSHDNSSLCQEEKLSKYT